MPILYRKAILSRHGTRDENIPRSLTLSAGRLWASHADALEHYGDLLVCLLPKSSLQPGANDALDYNMQDWPPTARLHHEKV